MLDIKVHPRTGEAFIQPGPAAAAPAERPLWEQRTEERPYALLPQVELPTHNRYGQAIDLIELTGGKAPNTQAGRSMYINENPAVGPNPNRNKQHGFFFTADNCIGCHACEAACSEKNENPPHLAFRSVGYVEGGSYPDYKRMNISMACNHCDDPVCLRGCPTQAYTKHTEYGAVLQDPETCFGCGYCTWVCPYNAPQLDPVKGQVSKCNMCVDRLEVGLKPACVAACVGNALDFGVIETVPANREQARVEIPGFPSPEITRPNIRFQQIRQLPDEMKRTDSMPIKYHKDDDGRFRPTVDRKRGAARQWNLKKLLGSHENAHVAFTLAAQSVMGAFALLALAPLLPWVSPLRNALTLVLLTALMGFGLFRLNMHLGKPMRFYRGFNNWRMSPVSREIAGVSLFFGGLGGSAFFALFPGFPLAAWLAPACTAAGLAGIALGGHYMIKLYRIKARPFWDHWQTASSFVGAGFGLGGLLLGLVALAQGLLTPALAAALGAVMATGFALEGIGLLAHARAMNQRGNEGAASHYEQTTTYGWPYLLRNALLGCALLLALLLAFSGAPALLAPLTLAAAAAAVLGRALFYVLVIPTTMPGAFFWKNKGFVEHAQATGLANMPQVGVVPLRH